MTHFQVIIITLIIKDDMGSHPFPFDYNTHVGGSNGVNTRAMKHWLPFLNNTRTLFKFQRILFLTTEYWLTYTPTKRRLTKSHFPILEPVMKLTLPSYTIYSSSLPRFTPDILWTFPTRGSRGSAIHVFLVLLDGHKYH